MIRWRQRIRRLTYVLADIISILFSFLITMKVCFFIRGMQWTLESLELVGFLFVVAVFHFFLYAIFSIYEQTIEGFGHMTYKLITKMAMAFVGTIVLLGTVLYYLEVDMNRLFVMVFMVILYAIVALNRLALKKLLFNNMAHNTASRNILVVGHSIKGLDYIRTIQKYHYLNLNIVGYIHIKTPNTYENIKHLGSLEDIEKIVKNYVVDEIAVARPLTYDYRLLHLLDCCQDRGITISMLLETRNDKKVKAQVAMVGDIPTLKFHSVSLNENQLFAKRVLDITGAFVGMLLFGIGYVLFGLFIKLESPGPVIFKQERVGKNGRVFEIWKFRSMGVDAEARKVALMGSNEMSGHMFKMTNDPRVTKIGGFLRKTSIDELPQFFNVLRGDMSLVGTRPPTVEEVEHYARHQHKRISITPGITGKWQISGRSDIMDFEDVVRLDSEYIADWTIWEDIRILFKTIKVVLNRKGSK